MSAFSLIGVVIVGTIVLSVIELITMAIWRDMMQEHDGSYSLIPIVIISFVAVLIVAVIKCSN